MAASENRSSARVAPRSVMRDGGDLGDDLVDRVGARLDRARCRSRRRRCGSARSPRTPPRRRRRRGTSVTAISMPSRRNTGAAVREVDRRQLDLLVVDVLPDVELGPVRQREHADVLALAVAAVVEAPQLGALVLRVPLAELVAEARRSAPWRGPSPRRAGRRRTPRRTRAPRSRRAAWWSAAGCATRRGPVSSTTRPLSIDVLHRRDDQPRAELARRAGRGTR